MNYYIYGKGKLQLDFEYMFPQYKISGYIVKEEDVQKILCEEQENFMIIICMRNEQEIIVQLENHGLKRGLNFSLASDYFLQLESVWKWANGRPIYIWGIGAMGELACEKISRIRMPIHGFIDSKIGKDKGINQFHGYTVYRLEEILKKKDVYFVIAIQNPIFLNEVVDLLKSKGKQEFWDYSYIEDLGYESIMMNKVYYAYPDKNNTFVCRQPFDYVQVEVNGSLNICCPDLIYYKSIGNLRMAPFGELWNADRAKLFRLSVMNRTYALCDHAKCYFLEDYLPDKSDEGYKVIDYDENKFRLRVAANIDKTCNLYCSSCRNKIIHLNREERDETIRLAEQIKEEIIPLTDTLIVAGYGEIFVSRIYKDLLADIEHMPEFNIISNGQLFDDKYVIDLAKKCDRLSIAVSVDAARKETYEKIRRGGNFERLMKNLYKIRELKREGVIENFVIAFVVQYENRNEIKDFIELGKELEVDRVNFTRINNWGTYSEQDFNQISLFTNDAIKDEYRGILENIDIYDDIIDWNNLGIGNKNYLYEFCDIRLDDAEM